MQCLSCGHENPDSARFCSECGAAVGVLSNARSPVSTPSSAKERGPRIAALSCPVCGGPLRPDDERCDFCGSFIAIEINHPSIDRRSLNTRVIHERIAEYRAAVRRDDNDEHAHYGLGVAYFNLGLLDDAADELGKAARLMPENVNIQTQLAVVYADLATKGDRDAEQRALERVERALQLSPNHAAALLVRARVQARRGQWGNAIATWSLVAEQDEPAATPEIRAFLVANAELLDGRDERTVRQVHRGAKKTNARSGIEILLVISGLLSLLLLASGYVPHALVIAFIGLGPFLLRWYRRRSAQIAFASHDRALGARIESDGTSAEELLKIAEIIRERRSWRFGSSQHGAPGVWNPPV